MEKRTVGREWILEREKEGSNHSHVDSFTPHNSFMRYIILLFPFIDEDTES